MNERFDRVGIAGDALVRVDRRTRVFSHGALLAYPFQANLHGLPLPIVRDCLVSFMEAQVAAAQSDADDRRLTGKAAFAERDASVEKETLDTVNAVARSPFSPANSTARSHAA